MAKKTRPRFGSMQVWPRKRAKRIYARVRSFPPLKEPKLIGFAGYKVGMTHVFMPEITRGKAKGVEVRTPVTIIETPPLKVLAIRFYKSSPYGLYVSKQILASNLDKELSRKITLPKKQPQNPDVNTEEFSEIRVLLYTQPKLTAIGKKKPEIFEVAIGGSLKEKFDYARENLGKEIYVNEIFEPGMYLDAHAITKGKGYQGPVKRFGISLRSHKSEKTRRGPGSLGGWKGQGHFMYRIAHAGQMGFHQRTDYNKLLLMIGDDVSKINTPDGFKHYGLVKNQYILIKGSIPGPAKRLIKLIPAIRPPYGEQKITIPEITYVSQSPSQGR